MGVALRCVARGFIVGIQHTAQVYSYTAPLLGGQCVYRLLDIGIGIGLPTFELGRHTEMLYHEA